MTRFNTTTPTTKTTNLAGGNAYKESPKLELASLLLTSFVADQYYRKGGDTVKDVKRLLKEVDAKFAAKAAIFARQEFGMRSISHVVAGELAGTVLGEEWTKNFYDSVVRRPDDMLEILAYYRQIARTTKTAPNAMKKGFAKALRRFDDYQLRKYQKSEKDLTLVDLVNIVRPIPNESINKLMKGRLGTDEVLTTKLKARREGDWRVMLRKRSIGYENLILNLKSIIETNDSELVDIALDMLTDEKLIRKSLILPFRYQVAYVALKQMNGAGVQRGLAALSKAIDISMANVPRFPGNTLVVLDESGSMVSGSSRGSDWGKRPADIGALYAAVLCRANEADLLTFSNNARYQTLNPADSILTSAASIGFEAGGTNFHAIFESLNQAYDRVIILSDMQGWMENQSWYYGRTETMTEELRAYEKKFNCNTKVYSFDLQGYGTLEFPANGVYAVAGFSEKVFDLMRMLEEDRNALVHRIEQIKL